MTISVSNSQQTFIGNASTTVFSLNFIIGIPSNFVAYHTTAAGVTTLLAPSQYTLVITAPVTGSLWGVGGSITYPNSGPAMPDGDTLFVSRLIPITQTTAISNQGTLLLSVIETALDTLCLEIQQISGRTGQIRGGWSVGAVYSYGDIVQDLSAGLNTLNYYMAANANTASSSWATDLAAGDWVLVINTVQIAGYATSAAASAAAASTSAGNAASSATSSATSATASAASATTATTQATNAASSASSASTSATTATTQATNASTSATNAATSATSASGSATTATTQASTATTQASNASTSATNAATSATAAAASAVLAASTFTATSTTSNTIGTGNFTFTTQANKNFTVNTPIIAVSNANAANYIHGTVSSYSGTTLVIAETDNGGSGTHTDWNIAVSGTQGTAGTGTGTVTSVTFTGDGTVLSSTPSAAVTTAGTVIGSLNTQAANKILAGPTSGGAVNPTFRSLVTADFPTTAVAAGSYTATNLTVDATGRITAASNGGASELVLLATAVASSSSTLDFLSAMSSSYSSYHIVLDNIKLSTTAVLQLRTSVDNTTFDTGAFYEATQVIRSMGSSAGTGQTGVGGTSYSLTASLASPLLQGFIDFTGQTTEAQFGLFSNIISTDGSTSTNGCCETVGNGSGGGASNSIVNAVRLLPSAGNITSGTAYLYGIKNT